VDVAERTEQGVLAAVNRYGRGLVNAHLGLADLARGDAEAGLAYGEEHADPWVTGINLWVLGFLEMSLGRLAETGRHLSRAWDIGESIGLREPGQWRFHADHLEALVGLGELGRAEVLLTGFEERARSTGRPWALATAARSRALLLAAQGDTNGAAAAISQALTHHEHLPMPFEQARTLLAQGQLQRRLSDIQAAARPALGRAGQCGAGADRAAAVHATGAHAHRGAGGRAGVRGAYQQGGRPGAVFERAHRRGQPQPDLP
jgi:hypothetical protein